MISCILILLILNKTETNQIRLTLTNLVSLYQDVHGKKVYIAAQGPLPHTVVDFWRMLWESRVEVVIMACNEYEGGKVFEI